MHKSPAKLRSDSARQEQWKLLVRQKECWHCEHLRAMRRGNSACWVSPACSTKIRRILVPGFASNFLTANETCNGLAHILQESAMSRNVTTPNPGFLSKL